MMWRKIWLISRIMIGMIRTYKTTKTPDYPHTAPTRTLSSLRPPYRGSISITDRSPTFIETGFQDLLTICVGVCLANVLR